LEVPLRFLTFDYPADERAGLYKGQVLFGDAILYTPILKTGDHLHRNALNG
jgi:alpha-glucosidase (family GH31 glycosyl hydrolase)